MCVLVNVFRQYLFIDNLSRHQRSVLKPTINSLHHRASFKEAFPTVSSENDKYVCGNKVGCRQLLARLAARMKNFQPVLNNVVL